MATRIFFLGLVVLVATATHAAILFEDDFNGTTLDTSEWYTRGTGEVTVSDGNVIVNVPSGDWAYSQLSSESAWTNVSDLYYSFTVGSNPEGIYNLFEVLGGGYVAMRNDIRGPGNEGWWFDAVESGVSEYHGYNQPGATAQTVSAGDVFTLKLGPTGSAAYKNGLMFDSTTTVPGGALQIDIQCWREPGGVASQTFDYISVSDTAPIFSPPGDADRNGTVDSADAAILAANWQKATDAIWSDGDFNNDGAVDDLDATILATNWQNTASTASTPEPSVLAMLIAGLTALAWRKR